MTTPATTLPTGAYASSKLSRRLTLYDATDQLLNIELWLDEHTDELIAAGGDIDALPELAKLLDEVEGNFVARVEALVARIHERSALQFGRMHESKRLAQLAKADERAIESLKAYLVTSQRRVNYTRLEAKTCRSTVVRNSMPTTTRDIDAAQPLWAIQAVAQSEQGAHFSIVHAPENDMPTAHAIAKLDAKMVDRLRGHLVALALQGCKDGEELQLEDGQTAAGVGAEQLLDFIDVVPPGRATYTLNRIKLVERWQQRYAAGVKQLESVEQDGRRKFTPYEVDVLAQKFANADPVFNALSVQIEQGYHLLLK